MVSYFRLACNLYIPLNDKIIFTVPILSYSPDCRQIYFCKKLLCLADIRLTLLRLIRLILKKQTVHLWIKT